MSDLPSPASAAASPDKPRVLLVDDERFNLNTLHGLLKEDHKIMVATGGDQALKAAVTGRPDLILLDINMPGMDGYEVCRRLKEDSLTSSIPIIFITGLADAEDETKGLELGAADYITKPFNLSVVRARVRTHRFGQNLIKVSVVPFLVSGQAAGRRHQHHARHDGQIHLTLDTPCGRQPIHARHPVVHQHEAIRIDLRLLLQHRQRLLGTVCRLYTERELMQVRLQDLARRGVVVHHQGMQTLQIT